MHSDYYKDLTKPQKELDELKKIIEQVKITFVIQPEPRGLGDAIMCCKEKIGSDDFGVLLGDDLIMECKPCYGIGDLINQYKECPAYYIGVKEVKLEDCHKYGIVKVDKTSQKMKISGMVEKPLENPPSRYAGVGRYILRNNVFDYLKQIKDDHIHEIMLTDAFRMACMVEDVYAYQFNGTRFDIGDHAGYVKATIAYALKDENIKDEIYEKFGFTVNIGIGNNKLCAKMASDFEKPNRVHTLFDNEIEEKMFPLPIEDLFMVGKKTAVKLRSMGYNTIGDVARSDPKKLTLVLKSFGSVIYERANGIDLSPVDSNIAQNKSISVSWTMEKDTDDVDEIKRVLFRQASEVGKSLRKEKLYASVVAVTFKTFDFVSFSKQMTLDLPICSNDDIYENALKILYKAWNFEKIRNIGIRLANFTDYRISQRSLFDDNDEKVIDNEKIQTALDLIRDKYGVDIIKPASFIEHDKENV